MSEPQQFEGTVLSVSHNKEKTTTTLKIQVTKGNKTISVFYKDYIRSQKNDVFSGICQLQESGRYILVNPPFIQPRATRQSVIECMVIALCRRGFYSSKAQTVYSRLLEVRRSEEGVCQMLSEYASDYLKSRNTKAFETYASPEMTDENIKEFLTWWHINRSLRRLYLLGLTPKDVREIKGLSLDQIYEKLINNPLSLVQLDVRKCQEIMKRYNVQPSDRQITVAIIARYLYNQSSHNGWVGCPVKKMLEVHPEILSDETLLNDLVKDYEVKFYEGLVYLPYQHQIECDLTSRIKGLLEMNQLPVKDPDPVYVHSELDAEQKAAICSALKYKFSVITGPAGSGKTTIIKEILHNLELLDIEYAILAFTGKAVSRIKEVIESNAPSTIHRFISCERNKTFKHVVIDEAGMVSNELMWHFFQAFPGDYSITLIGDENQLEPIEWGNMFGQLLRTKRVPVYRLKQNHRVSKDLETGDGQSFVDGIVSNSYNLINDEEYQPEQYNNFFIIPNRDIWFMNDLVSVILTEYKPDDITVLCPYKAELEQINEMISNLFFPDAEYMCDSRARKFKIGDRVMMVANNYEINVMNGDEGHVVGLSREQNCVRIRFFGGATYDFDLEIPHNFAETERLEKDQLHTGVLKHSFGKTVHKSQGSEYHCVILYIPDRETRGRFLNKKLMYTAITRAKTAFYCLGNTTRFIEGCNTLPYFRYDNLSKRLQ